MKTNDIQNFWILKKLVLSAPKALNRIELKQSFRNDSEQYSDSKIPHSSSINRIRELISNDAIIEQDSGIKSKKDLPMMQYRISIIGMIDLLKLCHERKFDQEIFENLDMLPYIEWNLNKLLIIFSKEQIFETLVNVCNNTTIFTNYIPFKKDFEKNKSKIIKYGIRNVLTDKQFQRMDWNIFHKFIQDDFSYTVSNGITLNSISRKKNRFFVYSKALNMISTMISCAFFHELILRCSSMGNMNKYHYNRNGKDIVLTIIMEIPQLKETYLKFINQINNTMKINMDLLKDVEKSISSKTPPIQFSVKK